MAFYTELPVYKDTYQLVLKVFEITRDFPREYRYTLGQDMKRDRTYKIIPLKLLIIESGKKMDLFLPVA